MKAIWQEGLRRRARALGWACLLLVAIVTAAASSAEARTLAISPLNGTPDASPHTQISFLGVPANEITHVSVVGSSTGGHSGTLRSYVSSAGASFLPKSGFAQGERVTVSAVVGPRGRTRRVGTSFTVAHLYGYRAPATGRPAPARAGTVQSFVSEPSLHPPKIAITASSPAASAGDIFITPTHGLGQSGPMILDGRGRLIWNLVVPPSEVAADLQLESYRGQPVLVWWQGRIPTTLGVGFGRDEIYSTAYTPVATISGGNGYEADLHDVQITPQGSAFITAYTLIDTDLSSVGGSHNGALQDSVLQEIDIPTGLVMFEWHAYGHVDLHDSYTTPPSSGLPWDFFHINSISADSWGDGNFIVSSRNTWAAYEVDHVSGTVMWHLGGRRSSFKMGRGTGTAYQHDVRWQPDHTLTIFDNGAVPKAHSQSRIIRERIDWKHRSVSLISRAVRVPALLTGSQGNNQVLANGNSFVGWGEAPDFTEFSTTGQILFDGHFPSPGQSYRAYRFPWSATPAAPPKAAAVTKGAVSTVYASWNGATGVTSWRVLGGPTPAALSTLAAAPVGGFETAIAVPASANFAVQAVGAGGEVLGTSAPVKG
jgi:hypothetical protein